MVCSYLLYGYDIIQVLKLCREEQCKADFFAQFEDGVMSDPCRPIDPYTKSVLNLTYSKPEKE